MKAWCVEKHGGPEVLNFKEVSTPQPGPMQVRIRVEAFSLNHMDIWVRQGVPGHRFPLPLIPGCDVAGVIDQFGEGAETVAHSIGFKIGSPVILNPGISCGMCPACLNGLDPLCPCYGLIGETQDGGSAEFIVVPLENVVMRPEGLSAADAACLPITFVTAWTMLTRKAHLQAGETVLIQAGGSGVSVAAIQMAKLLGAQVWTTVGDAEKAEKASALGADKVIQYKKTPFRAEVKRLLALSGKKGVDVALDHVGGETLQETLKCLAWGGRLVTCGSTSGSKVEIDLRHLFFKNISLLGSTLGSKSELHRMVSLVNQGKLKTVVDSFFSFDRYPEAVARLESRLFFGKIVVKLS
jgi:NADPH:quinone reductase-like Zn-dependent oxidoreductase